MKINIPRDVKFIIDKIYENGYEAFIVGGCVRDSLLGRIPNDYDITTNATPNEIIDIFKEYKIIDNGIKHGTVGIIIDAQVYEITTYRIEKEYEDNRRPKEVEFTSSIEEDLKRRDFTINAIAYNDKLGIIDKFNGIEDLKNGIIKTVGNPDERFIEDGLRMMRAIRFSSQLNFKIEENTLKSIYENVDIIKNISLERTSDEFTKTLLSNNPEKIELMYKTKIFEKLNIYNYSNNSNIDKNNLTILRECACTLEERLLMLEYLIIKRMLKNIKENERNKYYKENLLNKSVVNNLKYPKKLINNFNTLIAYMILDMDNLDKTEIKKLLNKIGNENLKLIFKLKKIYYINFLEDNVENSLRYEIKLLDEYIEIINKIELNQECYTIKELDIDGTTLKELGYRGVEIGNKLAFLLEEVIKNPTLNQKDTLINILMN